MANRAQKNTLRQWRADFNTTSRNGLPNRVLEADEAIQARKYAAKSGVPRGRGDSVLKFFLRGRETYDLSYNADT